jgi:hypothetical protein
MSGRPNTGGCAVWVIPPAGNRPWGAAWVAEGAAKLASLRGPGEVAAAADGPADVVDVHIIGLR